MKLMVSLMEKSCDTLMEKLEKIADSGESWNTFLQPTKEQLKQYAVQHLYSFGYFR